MKTLAVIFNPKPSASCKSVQIAIFEISFETSGTYNVNGGTTTFSGGGLASSGATALAQTWLNELPSVVDEYAVWVVQSPTHQDLLFGVKQPGTPVTSPVPEPPTIALLGAGLLGIGFHLRRRRMNW